MKRYAVLLALALSLLLVQAAAANLVTNGGFETGSFSGWTQSGDLRWSQVVTTPVHSGTYAAQLGPITMGYLTQTLTTIPNVSYELHFWLQSQAQGTVTLPNQFLVNWNGINQTNQSNVGEFLYKEYVFPSLVATTGSTPLEFGFLNVPNYFFLDNVSVNAVPIPGAVWLLGSGLLGLAGLRRKFKS